MEKGPIGLSYHKEILSKLCRVCGSYIQLKTGYVKAKSVSEYSNILFAVYEIDTEVESDEIYPKFLCSSCKRKLDRLVQKEPTTETRKAYTFQPHNSEKCSLCFVKTKTYKSQAHVRFFSDVFQKRGFLRLDTINDKSKLVYIFPENMDEKTQIKYEIAISENFEWSLTLYGRALQRTNKHLQDLPTVLNDLNIQSFVNYLLSLKICAGITDYADVLLHRLEIKQPFTNDSKEIVAFVENSNRTVLRKEEFNRIRHKNCSLFSETEKDICNACHSYKDFLRTARYRLKKKSDPVKLANRVSDTSKTNFRFLSNEELMLRLENVQKHKREALVKVANMSVMISKLISKEGEQIEEKHHEGLAEIMSSTECTFEPDTPQWLLWQQQKEQAKKKDSRGMRWHPLIIRWCLSIYHTSAAAYRQLTSKKLQFIKLPHTNTLKKFSQFTTPSTGFNPDIIERLIIDSNLEVLQPYQKNVTICFDEMKIKADLVYRKSTGQLVGYTELGNINDELRLFESKVKSEEYRQDFATHVIVYMVRGIFTNLVYPFGFFASLGFTAAQLFPCTMEAISIIESIGLKVRVLTSDGATPNRKFFDMLTVEEEGNIYWTTNPHDESRKIYFMSDVPHLLKTTRNCLENSHWNKNTRNMHVGVVFNCV